MTKTTRTTKKSTAVTEDQTPATTEQQTSTQPAPTLDPEKARQDLAAIFAKAAAAAAKPKTTRAKAARPKAD